MINRVDITNYVYGLKDNLGLYIEEDLQDAAFDYFGPGTAMDYIFEHACVEDFFQFLESDFPGIHPTVVVDWEATPPHVLSTKFLEEYEKVMGDITLSEFAEEFIQSTTAGYVDIFDRFGFSFIELNSYGFSTKGGNPFVDYAVVLLCERFNSGYLNFFVINEEDRIRAQNDGFIVIDVPMNNTIVE